MSASSRAMTLCLSVQPEILPIRLSQVTSLRHRMASRDGDGNCEGGTRMLSGVMILIGVWKRLSNSNIASLKVRPTSLEFDASQCLSAHCIGLEFQVRVGCAGNFGHVGCHYSRIECWEKL